MLNYLCRSFILMDKISHHFKRKEFACKCGCGFDAVDKELLDVLEKVRTRFNQPVTITSGCRCVEHNKDIGGSESSQHVFGKAADIVVKNISPRAVFNFLDKYQPLRYGLGLYEGWVHVDVRSTKARW